MTITGDNKRMTKELKKEWVCKCLKVFLKFTQAASGKKVMYFTHAHFIVFFFFLF